MQPWAAIQQPQLMLDACDGCILFITQSPVCGVVNVALQHASFGQSLTCSWACMWGVGLTGKHVIAGSDWHLVGYKSVEMLRNKHAKTYTKVQSGQKVAYSGLLWLPCTAMNQANVMQCPIYVCILFWDGA